VDDLAAAYLAMAGDDVMDPWSRPVPVDVPQRSKSPHTTTLGIVAQWFAHPLASEIRREIDSFIDRCADVGYRIVEVNEPTLRLIPEVTRASRAEVLSIHGARFSAQPERYGPDVRLRLQESSGVTVPDMVEAARWRSNARGTVDRLRDQGITALVAPTVGVRSKYIGVDDIDIDGEAVFHRLPLAEFTAPINAIGIPALSIPIADSGMPPVSVQLIGPSWAEADLLAIGHQLESEGITAYAAPTTNS
jgi:aspartyl-tRNA(Asn)/glutamyl-tRNA(Gln) amidotransferase subunit A